MAYNPDTMSFEEPSTDMVYVSGLPSNTTEEDIAAHFGSIGLLKEDKKKNKPKIWLYRDKGTNQLKVRDFLIHDMHAPMQHMQHDTFSGLRSPL